VQDDNIDSLINKSRFLMSEGSSLNLRQPSLNKKKWDDNSEIDVINSGSFDYRIERGRNNNNKIKVNQNMNVNNYYKWDFNDREKELIKQNELKEMKINDELYFKSNVSSAKFEEIMKGDFDTGDEINVQKP